MLGSIGVEYRQSAVDRKRKAVPGFAVIRGWNLETVIELEERGELESRLIDALAVPLESWGESLQWE